MPNTGIPAITPTIVISGCVSAKYFEIKYRNKLSILVTSKKPQMRIPYPAAESPYASEINPAGTKITGAPITGKNEMKNVMVPQKKGSGRPKTVKPIPSETA